METLETKKKRFPFGRFLAWKTSDISAAGLNIIVTGYLMIYCTDFLGLAGTVVGTILLVSNLFDAVTDLIAGFIIDNTHSKLGKLFCASEYPLTDYSVVVFSGFNSVGVRTCGLPADNGHAGPTLRFASREAYGMPPSPLGWAQNGLQRLARGTGWAALRVCGSAAQLCLRTLIVDIWCS